MKGILDTSVFVVREQGRPLGSLPDEAAISVMTLAELHIGVLVAPSPAVRATRLRTLADVERTFDAVPVDDAVARRFAELASDARRKGRRPKLLDTLIAATALEQGVAVYTQDEDFGRFPGLRVVRI